MPFAEYISEKIRFLHPYFITRSFFSICSVKNGVLIIVTLCLMLNVALLAQWTLNLYYWLDLRSFTVIKSWLKIESWVSAYCIIFVVSGFIISMDVLHGFFYGVVFLKTFLQYIITLVLQLYFLLIYEILYNFYFIFHNPMQIFEFLLRICTGNLFENKSTLQQNSIFFFCLFWLIIFSGCGYHFVCVTYTYYLQLKREHNRIEFTPHYINTETV